MLPLKRSCSPSELKRWSIIVSMLIDPASTRKFSRGSCTNMLMIHRCVGMVCKHRWKGWQIDEYISYSCGLPLFKDGIYFSKFLHSYKRGVYEMTKMFSIFRVSLTELTEIKSSWYQIFLKVQLFIICVMVIK